jgi:ketosteroid isomerase-like protein
MGHPNLDLIDRFFAAYSRRDHAMLRDVLAEDAIWTFPGKHPLSGTVEIDGTYAVGVMRVFWSAAGAPKYPHKS